MNRIDIVMTFQFEDLAPNNSGYQVRYPANKAVIDQARQNMIGTMQGHDRLAYNGELALRHICGPKPHILWNDGIYDIKPVDLRMGVHGGVDKWAHANPEHRGHLKAFVQSKYGALGFTKSGTIKRSVLKELVHEGNAIKPYNHMAQFALNINKSKRG